MTNADKFKNEIAHLEQMPDHAIDFSDIPQLTDEQLAQMRPCIKLMADYTSTGVWNKFGVNQDLEDYPISEDLKNGIKVWTRWYESSFMNDLFAMESFNSQGKTLAVRLKEELPKWEVLFFDEASHDLYEVTSTLEFELCPRIR